MNPRLPWRIAAYGLFSVAIYALVYRAAFLAPLGPLRNLATTMLASLALGVEYLGLYGLTT